MKLLVVFALVAVALARPDDTYSTKYDSFDIDGLIQNDRLMKAYISCFHGDGKCTPEGKEIKQWIPEATQSSCGKCSEKQKVIAAKAIKAIKEKFAADYEKLIKAHDPEGKHGDELQAFLTKYGA